MSRTVDFRAKRRWAVQPIERQLSIRGINITYYEWGERGGTDVLLAHATGFHARCWDATIRELGSSFHCVALDMRGHGRSDNVGPYEWGTFGADLVVFADAIGFTRGIGVGHSMGGHSLTQTAAQRQERFAALVLVDPVIMAPEAYVNWERDRPFADAADHPVARRRNDWSSADEMFERFRSRHPFNLWREDVLHDYCEYGIVPTKSGFELACPPIVEASIYMGSAGHQIDQAIDAVEQPVSIMRAFRTDGDRTEMDFSQSPTWPELAGAFKNGKDIHLPELTHFIPMQRPDLVAEEIRRLSDAVG